MSRINKLQRAIKEILRISDMGESDIALQAGTSTPTINRIKNGRINDTSFTIGDKIIELRDKLKST